MLTVIIPTIPDRQPKLEQTMAALARQTVSKDLFSVIIIWDGQDQAPSFSFDPSLRVSVIAVGQRRGQAAGRNSGLEAIQTPLGMFLDDDQVPVPTYIEQHLSFHNNNPDPKLMAVGKVTWKGHPQFNGIMDWFQEEGGFSIFKQLRDGEYCPSFLSGVTSFKTEILKNNRFNEDFTAYGGEDIELGIRLFHEGVRIVFLENALAVHLKDLDADTYFKDHRGAGYSMGNLFCLHPDSGLPPALLLRHVFLKGTDEEIRELIDLANRLSLPVSVETRPILGNIIRTLHAFANARGWRNYAIEHFPGYETAEHHLISSHHQSHEQKGGAALAAKSCPHLALIPILAAGYTGDISLKQSYLEQARESMPHYALPLLKYIGCLSPSESKRSIKLVENFFTNHGHTMSLENIKKYYFLFGREMIRLGEDAMALELLQKSSDYEPWPGFEPDLKVRALFETARLLIRIGQFNNAKETISQLLVSRPDHVLGRILESQFVYQEDTLEAKRLLEIAKNQVIRMPHGERPYLRKQLALAGENIKSRHITNELISKLLTNASL